MPCVPTCWETTVLGVRVEIFGQYSTGQCSTRWVAKRVRGVVQYYILISQSPVQTVQEVLNSKATQQTNNNNNKVLPDTVVCVRFDATINTIKTTVTVVSSDH